MLLFSHFYTKYSPIHIDPHRRDYMFIQKVKKKAFGN